MRLLAEGITLENVTDHMAAIWLVNEIFRQQSQPLSIVSCDDSGFAVSLRVNLQNIQFERLILKPINDYLTGYTVNADFKARKLEFVRDAVSGRKTQVARNSKQASD